ncbi:type II toxin-antitoxin system RelE/ParE family toxin [Ligilactobacillus faecis]|uniref:Type II toxin-antitoxin system RelE/ParE family toxin n=1 Tax=Ligilactobacillus faecis TaxID=762833 RepID=A0ABV4DRH3_9LACO
MDDKPKFQAYSYNGESTYFEEFLDSIPNKDAIKLLQVIRNIEELGMLIAMQQKWVKRLDDDIFEIRSKVASNIQRVLYFQKVGQEYIITHGFTKKTQKTPKKEIERAHRIMNRYFIEEEL